MALIEFQGYVFPDWMLYSFFFLIGLMGIIGFLIIRQRFKNPDEIIFYAWEYLPSGMIPKVYQLTPEEVGPSHFILKEGDKERHVMHSHPWVIPGTKEAVFTIPFGSLKADNPEEMFHRNRDVRTPFPLVDVQAEALARINQGGRGGFSLRKNWFTLLIIFLLGFLAGLAYLSYSKGIPI